MIDRAVRLTGRRARPRARRRVDRRARPARPGGERAGREGPEKRRARRGGRECQGDPSSSSGPRRLMGIEPAWPSQRGRGESIVRAPPNQNLRKNLPRAAATPTALLLFFAALLLPSLSRFRVFARPLPPRANLFARRARCTLLTKMEEIAGGCAAPAGRFLNCLHLLVRR